MRWLPIICMALMLPSLSSRCRSQLRENPDSSAIRTTPSVSDTSRHRGSVSPLLSSASTDSVRSAFHPTKSPGIAMLLSALFPGAGQVYNRSYWKVPIIVGLGIYFASEWLDQNRRYIDSRDKYLASLAVSPLGDQLELTRRDFYRNQRDTFTWYFAILYFVNIADAYVDASLYDFNVGGDLSLRVVPEAPSLLKLQLKF